MALPVLFNLWTLRAQAHTIHNLNDANMHSSMVRWATSRLQAGHLPFDGWYPYLGVGFPQFHHYQSLPHIITGALGVVIGANTAFTITLYLLLTLWPICVYASARLFGFDRWASAGAAMLSPLLASISGYGFEQGSYTWQGYGMWAQLWGMWAMPFALALSYRAVVKRGSLVLAAGALGLTLSFHFLAGYLAAVALGVWVLVQPRPFWQRLSRAAVIGMGAIAAIVWMLVPLLTDQGSANYSNYGRGTFWYDSYGGRKVLGWLLSGELFDHGRRIPVITILFAVGVVVSLTRARREVLYRAMLGFWVLSLLLFMGRPLLGAALNVLPGHRDLFLPRFITGVHLGGLYLAGVGGAWLAQSAIHALPRLRVQGPTWATAGAIALVTLVVLYPAWSERADVAATGNSWMTAQRAAQTGDGADLRQLIDQAKELGGGRIYAGLRTNWGRDMKVYAVPAYAELVEADADSVGFTLRVASLATPAEQFFDDTNLAQYDLYNIGYLILPPERVAPKGAIYLATAGRFRLFAMPTTGYLRVVDTVTPALVANSDTIGLATTPFLQSAQLAAGQFPPIAFNGADAAPASSTGTESGSPGSVTDQKAALEDGHFTGTVDATRNAVVVLKASYHQRWMATVDGTSVSTQIVAPGFVAVPVPAGHHTVAFTYQPYPYYWLLFVVSAASLIALLLAERWVRANGMPRMRPRRQGNAEPD